MAAPSPNSAARSWSAASPMRRASRRAACAAPSKRAATPRGIRPARRGCWCNNNSVTLVIPDRVRQLDRRGARQEDAAAPLDGSAVDAGRARAQAVRLERHPRHRDVRSRAGIFPDRQQLLFRAPGPAQRRPHAVRRASAEGPGARGSVLRLDPGARAGLHGGIRSRALQVSACRSRPATTKSRRRNTKWRRSSKAPTSPPITR